jgi:hypothetical protein
MKRIIKSALLFYLLASLSGYSQMSNDDLYAFLDDAAMHNKFSEIKKLNFSGSPYLNDEYQTGNISFSDGNKYNNILLRYNIYSDQFEFTRENKDYALERNPDFYLITLGDRVFVYREFEYKDKDDAGYLEQIVEGDYSLYLKHYILLRSIEDIGAFSEESKPTFWHQKPVIMIGSTQNKVAEINGSKDFLNKFPELRDSVDKYTGKKKLRLKSVEDYKDLISYLNSI